MYMKDNHKNKIDKNIYKNNRVYSTGLPIGSLLF